MNKLPGGCSFACHNRIYFVVDNPLTKLSCEKQVFYDALLLLVCN